MPSPYYLDTIARGYVAYDLPLGALRSALQSAKKRCLKRGVDRWVHDGRKRMRPVTSSAKPRRAKRRSRTAADNPRNQARQLQRSAGRLLFSGGYLPTPDEAAAMGISPATLAELELEAREEGA